MAWSGRNKRILVVAVAAVAVGVSAFALWSYAHRRLPVWDFKVPDLSAEERASLGLSAEDERVRVTPADIAYVKSVGDDVLASLSTFFGPRAPKWWVFAARPVGDCLLLWVGFPEIADGGIHLIYSKKTNAVIGCFLGGYLG